MAKEFKLPELGENVTKGVVAAVLVAEGDVIAKDQPILEIETDKAVVEIPSPFAGKVLKLNASEGKSIAVGEVVMTIDTDGAGSGGAAKDQDQDDEPAAKSSAGRRQGAAPEASEPKPDAMKKAGAAEDKGGGGKPQPRLHVLERPEGPSRRKGPLAAPPSVRKLARELGVDIQALEPSDPSGRVTADDVRRAAKGAGADSAPEENGGEARPQRAASAAPAIAQARAPEGAEGEDRWGPITRQDMNAVRKATAERMTQSWTTIPHVTHHDKADVTSLEALRARHGKRIEQAGGKFTVTAVLVKLLAEALRRFPKFNASVDMATHEILYKRYYNIGVAVDTPHGLLVPVIRDADQKSIAELCVELPELAEKARNRKLALEDMQGGTFTISNLGGIGGIGFTPIINAPEAAILGVSRTQIEPVLNNGQLQPRAMLPLSLSYDHRVIDGAEAARFARWVAEALEQPWMLFLDI